MSPGYLLSSEPALNVALFPVSVPGAVLYGLAVAIVFYTGFTLLTRCWPDLEPRKLAYTVVMFALFGASGEEVVNTVWKAAFGGPMWEYRLYPAQGGHISYFFFLIWGLFGFYTYLRDRCFPGFGQSGKLFSGVVFGVEAIALEFAVNIPYYLIFGDYIFYYFPANLGPLSHFSCLQVIPFYMAIAFVTRRLIAIQEAAGFRYLKSTLGFYAMVMVAYLDLVHAGFPAGADRVYGPGDV